MICSACAINADQGTLGPEPHLVACQGGTWCDCQHQSKSVLVKEDKEDGQRTTVQGNEVTETAGEG